MENYTLTGSQDPLQGEYKQVLYWTIKDKPARAIGMQLLGIPVFIVTGLAFSYLAFRIGGWDGSLDFNLGGLVVGLAAAVATIILHELVHALFMIIFRARPIFGIMWKIGAAYATAPGYGFRRNSYLTIALSPLVALSALAVGLMFLTHGSAWVPLIVICAVLNASGATGDLWIASIVLRYPKQAIIVDEKDGIRVLLPGEISHQ